MARKIGEPFAVDVLAKAEEELQKGYREIAFLKFGDKENVVINVYHPNISEQSKIAMNYSTIFNDLMKNSNLMTRKQMLELLELKGIWTEKDEQKVNDLRTVLTAAEIAILSELRNKKPRKEYIDKKQKEYDRVRDEILALVTVRESYLAQTLESKAEESANLLKMVLCVKFQDGNSVWNNEEELKNARGLEVLRIASEASYFWNGLSQEVLSMLPGMESQGAALEQSQEQTVGKEDIPSQVI